MNKKIKILFTVLLVTPFLAFSQDEPEVNSEPTEKVESTETKRKLEREAFDGMTLIENQTNVLRSRNTVEMFINHRFGLMNTDDPHPNDMLGLWGAANIRFALNYSIIDRVTVGFGTTKDNRLQDFSIKGALLRQKKGGGMPVSVSYYGNYTIDARKKENFYYTEDRYSFFNQLIIARRINGNISVQATASVSHYNLVESYMQNEVLSVGFGGRVKISPQTAIILEYNQPLTKYDVDSLSSKPGVSVGVEFSTGAHAFQIFITNNSGIVQQKNNMYNQNEFFKGDFMIGFNITRLWHL